MNYFRTIVSGDKKRHHEMNYDLDLSYITPRVIAMAFPASGIETIYRNNISDVANFIKTKHQQKYLVINLSGRYYDYNKFDNQVEEYDWVDHHAPPLIPLFKICSRMKEFLQEDKENVVCINCLAGKGRTGTVICCFLLFSGLFTSPSECFSYFSKKRFQRGEGVTQPSQRRYVNYFSKMLISNYAFPYMIYITGIYINKVPSIYNDNFKPFIQFHDNNSQAISYSNQMAYKEQTRIFPNQVDMIPITDDSFSRKVIGDVTIKVYNNEMLKSKKIGRISFNTAMIDPEDELICFNLNEVDPDRLVKNTDYSKEFKIILKYMIICNCQEKGNESIGMLCDECRVVLRKDIIEWKEVNNIINEHKMNNSEKDGKEILFGNEENDIKNVLFPINKSTWTIYDNNDDENINEYEYSIEKNNEDEHEKDKGNNSDEEDIGNSLNTSHGCIIN